MGTSASELDHGALEEGGLMVWMARSPGEQKAPGCIMGRRLWTMFCRGTLFPAVHTEDPYTLHGNGLP